MVLLLCSCPYMGMLKPWLGTLDHVNSLAWDRTPVSVMGVTCAQLHTLSYVSPTTVYSFGILDQKLKKSTTSPNVNEVSEHDCRSEWPFPPKSQENRWKSKLYILCLLDQRIWRNLGHVVTNCMLTGYTDPHHWATWTATFTAEVSRSQVMRINQRVCRLMRSHYRQHWPRELE